MGLHAFCNYTHSARARLLSTKPTSRVYCARYKHKNTRTQILYATTVHALTCCKLMSMALGAVYRMLIASIYSFYARAMMHPLSTLGALRERRLSIRLQKRAPFMIRSQSIAFAMPTPSVNVQFEFNDDTYRSRANHQTNKETDKKSCLCVCECVC